MDQIDKIVRANFVRPDLLTDIDWPKRLAAAKHEYAAVGIQDRPKVVNDLLSSLKYSHTHYYTQSGPDYWQIASIFEPVLRAECAPDKRPALPIRDPEIGVFWKRFDQGWFVGGLYADGPAEKAGIKLGDQVIAADGQPFDPLTGFSNGTNLVSLTIRRFSGDLPAVVKVTPAVVSPSEAMLSATSNSLHFVHRNGKSIAYIRIWTWTSILVQQAVLQNIRKANGAHVDGFIIDIRDGWGGASPEYMSIFDDAVPRLIARDRKNAMTSFDAQIRAPSVLLVNGGTRSGKEVIAWGVQHRHLATLVGERTAGAVAFGEPFCLDDGSLLYLAVENALVDGQSLDGIGVKPDIEVKFDPRFAGGKDAQMEAALDLLAPRRG